MHNIPSLHFRKIVIGIIIAAIALPIFFVTATPRRPADNGHSVQIAFGFHVNLYHSFRNDTNDENGFGKDIRIIRTIIKTLDHYNAKGVPVKGVWDFDNLFSLQEILPQYAPDIIDAVKRRVTHNGDEVILMSFNNGLVSAMTTQELQDAMRWAVANPWQSGVKDLFGTYTPIVRPQEMMTTPGNFSIYKQQGIQAVALYYSATPFDGFRVFSRPLTRKEAHNPLLYHHPKTGEEMVIIPTYHIGDLVEHVSLRNWAGELHRLQAEKRFDNDALIFINYDADSELWGGVTLPPPLSWLPNTGGLAALIEEVMDLPYVRFTTLGEYLNHHVPVGRFYFSQDTADGSFNGYNSWSEKADTSHYWTAIEHSRRLHTAALKTLSILNDPADRADIEQRVAFANMKRLRALSTTNFGMATPFLARQREAVMEELTTALNRSSDEIEQLITQKIHPHLRKQPPPVLTDSTLKWQDTLLILQTNTQMARQGNRFLHLPVSDVIQPDAELVLLNERGDTMPLITIDTSANTLRQQKRMLYVPGDVTLTDGIYHLYTRSRPKNNAADTAALHVDDTVLSNRTIAVRFTPNGQIEGIYRNKMRIADQGSLIPYLKYGRKWFHATPVQQKPALSQDGYSAAAHLTGVLAGPPGKTQTAGWMDYTVRVAAGLPYIFLNGDITYPTTMRPDAFKNGRPGLMRQTDMRWQEVAPAEIRFTPHATKRHPIRILKRNYLGVETAYALDYFKHDSKNRNLDNINNHITASYVGIVAGNYGMAVAKNNGIQSNFAYAPVKMRHHAATDSFSVTVNPFGTYFGHQYQPPTWGNRQGYAATLQTGEQFASSAPTYNGKRHRFSLMLTFFDGQQIPDSIKNDLIGYAHPPLVISRLISTMSPPAPKKLAIPNGLVATYTNGTVQFNWNPDERALSHFRIYCGTRPHQYEQIYPATGTTLTVKHYTTRMPFKTGQRYYACIKAVAGYNRQSHCSSEITFSATPPPTRHQDVPLALGLRIFWANVKAFFINT